LHKVSLFFKVYFSPPLLSCFEFFFCYFFYFRIVAFFLSSSLNDGSPIVLLLFFLFLPPFFALCFRCLALGAFSVPSLARPFVFRQLFCNLGSSNFPSMIHLFPALFPPPTSVAQKWEKTFLSPFLPPHHDGVFVPVLFLQNLFSDRPPVAFGSLHSLFVSVVNWLLAVDILSWGSIV